MKYLAFQELTSKEAVREFAEKRNLMKYFSAEYEHPKEDYLVAQDNPPVFVVADGVTLDFRKIIERKEKYPNPSPAEDVAKIFCKSVIKSASGKYHNFTVSDIAEVFKESNSHVREYNEGVGKTDISGNRTGYFSATGAFVVIKENRAYWASICDSFVAHLDKNMTPKFISSGLCNPYAVINGEERMAEHLESGVFELEEGDRVFVFTDGFEHYVKNPEFLEYFKKDENVVSNISEFSQRMNLVDPEKYGHERSLVTVFV